MIKKTYYNLPEEKRERIYNALLDEFSEKSYAKVSVTNICREADIAKGSFYQYFDNKKDALFVVLDNLVQMKWRIYEEVVKDIEEVGFFRTFELMIEKNLNLISENPKLHRLSGNILSEQEIVKELFMRYGDMTRKALHKMIITGMERNEIDKSYDIDFLMYVFTSLQKSVADYIVYLRKSEKGFEIGDYRRVIDQYIRVFEKGVGR